MYPNPPSVLFRSDHPPPPPCAAYSQAIEQSTLLLRAIEVLEGESFQLLERSQQHLQLRQEAAFQHVQAIVAALKAVSPRAFTGSEVKVRDGMADHMDSHGRM